MEGEQETVPKLSNGTRLNDLEWPITQISRSRYYSASNNWKTVQELQWPSYRKSYRTAPFSMILSDPLTLNLDFNVTMLLLMPSTRDLSAIAKFLCGCTRNRNVWTKWRTIHPGLRIYGHGLGSVHVQDVVGWVGNLLRWVGCRKLDPARYVPACSSGQAPGRENKNLAIANRSRVSCAHNTSRAFIGLITPWPWNLG